jgi:hypothetical protein
MHLPFIDFSTSPRNPDAPPSLFVDGLPFDNPDAVIRFDDGQIRIADAVRVWARAPERTAREFVMAAQWLAVHEETRPVSFAAIERMLNEAADLIGQARTELAHAEATQNAERLAAWWRRA